MRLGTGLKIKTIEALGLGRATVTSPAGASGLEGAAGDAFMVAHDAAEFADQVVRLLADPPARRALAARAIAFARSWNEACLAGLATILTAESTPDGRVRL
jgi:spore maturation protein CgeB